MAAWKELSESARALAAEADAEMDRLDGDGTRLIMGHPHT